MADDGDLGHRLLHYVTGQVDGPEEWMHLDVLCPIPAQAASATQHSEFSKLINFSWVSVG